MPSTSSDQRLLDSWLDLGLALPGMDRVEPPFTAASFQICRDVCELLAHLLDPAGHPVGRALVLEDACFLNLSAYPGEDEWLAIKGEHALGNIPLLVRDVRGEIDQIATARAVTELAELLHEASPDDCTDPAFLAHF